ncbi:MAG: hypothetical protein HRT89_21385, partial [Lentisphaeria bacterium]|nr:hypothetical protein [Lentisphaeria bacterium]NQZ70615.1 hypothetical protein [Lentisphaeria bacterium]
MKYLLYTIFFFSMLLSAENKKKHPYMILTEKQLIEIRGKIKTDQWAQDQYMKLKKMVDEKQKGYQLQSAILYAITKDKDYAKAPAQAIRRGYGMTGAYKWDLGWAEAIMYDLIYDTLTDAQRKEAEDKMRTGGKNTIKAAHNQRQTWNMYHLLHAQVGIIGFAIGDEELIEYGMNDPGGGSFEKYGPKTYGGFYQVMEANVKDGNWHEPNAYQYYLVLPPMVTLIEAASNYYDKDLWHWRSPNGDRLKDIFLAAIDRTFPAEDMGIAGGSYRLSSYGDTSTQFKDMTKDSAYNNDYFLVNNPSTPSGGIKKKRLDLGSLFEVAYRRTKDPRFAWVISRNESRDWSDRTERYQSAFMFAGLTHGLPIDPKKVKAPEAKSRMSSNASFAMLRADESPSYWSGKGPACFFMMGNYPFRSHAHNEDYQITYHDKGRIFYPDIDVIQYERDHEVGWTHRSIAHNTLVVDGGNMNNKSKYIHKSDFNKDVKYIIAYGSPYQRKGKYGTAAIGSQIYPKNVYLARSLMLTDDYMLDLFWAKSNKEHVYDWALHGHDDLQYNGKSYRTDKSLPESKDLEPYKWIKDVRSIDGTKAWSVDWLQHFGKPQNTVGIKLRMLGAESATTYLGEGPLYQTDLAKGHWDSSGNHMKVRPPGPVSRLPMIVARRKTKNVLYAALHETYYKMKDGKKVTHKGISSYDLIAKTEDAIAVKITGPNYVDYCMVAFKDNKAITKYVAVPGVKITELSNAWTFRTDPKKEGEKGKWNLPAHDASEWKKIRTDATWEKQGYANYDGIGWYRSTFTAAKKFKG